MEFVGLAGKARIGKDTVAQYLQSHYQFETYAFADPVKQAASAMFGVPDMGQRKRRG